MEKASRRSCHVSDAHLHSLVVFIMVAHISQFHWHCMLWLAWPSFTVALLIAPGINHLYCVQQQILQLVPDTCQYYYLK